MTPLLASLLHSLWIGALLWAGGAGLARLLPATAARLRHALALSSAALLFLGWGTTWMMESANRVPVADFSTTAPAPSLALEAEPPAASPTVIANPPADAVAREVNASEEITRLATRERIHFWLEIAWAVGALLSLIRMSWQLAPHGARWAQSHLASVPVPAVWQDAWSGIIADYAAKLDARLVAVADAGTPFVVGLVSPVIVVPLATCAGVSPALARAALAHELAHIVRRDWLAELALRIMEALLFFNPFARLIARRVRDEREACCDDWARRLLDQDRAAYAQALLEWGRLFACENPPSPVTAFALGTKHGTLLRRVERMLGTKRTFGFRPRTWRGALTLSVASLVAIGGFALAVRLGANALSDQERVELLDNLAARHIEPDPFVRGTSTAQVERTISGQAIAPDGTPIKGAHVHFLSTGIRETSATTDADGRFRSRRPLAGPVRLTVRAEGFALRVTHAAVDEAELAGPIELSPGHRVHLRVLGADGAPLPGTLVQWTYDVSGPDNRDQVRTDASGHAVLPHQTEDCPVFLSIEGPGHATIGHGPLRVNAYGEDSPLTVRLPPATSTRLRLVFDDGTPVPDARLHVAASSQPWSPTSPYPIWSYPNLRTDANGEALVEHLHDHVSYTLEVNSPRSDPFAVTIPALPDRPAELTAKAPRLRVLKLRLINFPDPFRGQTVDVQVSRALPGDKGMLSRSPRITIDANGSAETTLNNIGEGRFILSFSDRRLRGLNIDVPSATDLLPELVIDHAKIGDSAVPLRRVEVRFLHGGKRVFPAGRFHIHRYEPGVWNSDGFALETDKPLFAEWTPGTRLKLSSGWGLIGVDLDLSTADREREIVIDETTEFLDVPVKPAGLVRVKVLDANGEPVRDALLFGEAARPKKENNHTLSFPGQLRIGEWMISTPVALDGKDLRIWASQGFQNFAFARSEPVSLTRRRPVADVVVRLPRITEHMWRVLDRSGSPVPSAHCQFRIEFTDTPGRSPVWSVQTATTNADGEVVVGFGEDFPEWKDLQVHVMAVAPGFARTYSTVSAPALRNPPPVIILDPAKVFLGRVVNVATGQGFPGATIRRYPTEGRELFTSPEVLSNENGYFTFTDLAPGERFRLSVSWPGYLKLKQARGFRYDYTTEDGTAVLPFEPQ